MLTPEKGKAYALSCPLTQPRPRVDVQVEWDTCVSWGGGVRGAAVIWGSQARGGHWGPDSGRSQGTHPAGGRQAWAGSRGHGACPSLALPRLILDSAESGLCWV